MLLHMDRLVRLELRMSSVSGKSFGTAWRWKFGSIHTLDHSLSIFVLFECEVRMSPPPSIV
jgi:hypothetical protein